MSEQEKPEPDGQSLASQEASQLEPPINPEYLNVRFIAQRPATGWPVKFGIVTAWNPMDEVSSPAENAKAHSRLIAKVKASRLFHFPVTGASVTSNHQEEGIGVFTKETAMMVAWGREFRQRAIFYVDEGELWLISCMNDERHSLGRWENRLQLLPGDGPDMGRLTHGQFLDQEQAGPFKSLKPAGIKEEAIGMGVASPEKPHEPLTPEALHQKLTETLDDLPGCKVLPYGSNQSVLESPQLPALQRMTVIISPQTPPSEPETHEGHPGCANYTNGNCSWGKGDLNDDQTIRLWDGRPVCHDCVENHNYWTWRRSRYAPKNHTRNYVDWKSLELVPDAPRLR